MARTPKRVASATGNDQSQADQTGSDTVIITLPVKDPTDTSISDLAANKTGTGEGQGDSQPGASDATDTPAPAPIAETPADTSNEPTPAPAPAPAPAPVLLDEEEAAPIDNRIEVRVLVAYDGHLPNDVIAMDRAEAELRLEQVDADPVAVAYAKSLVA